MRLEQLIGEAAIDRINQSAVLLLGVGGVGSWCAEALIRSGVGRLELVDPDSVARSNLNRQLMATQQTIGQLKVNAMIDRLRTISPEATLVGHPLFYNKECELPLQQFDLVIDCIDSLRSKVDLAVEVNRLGIPFLSSMGAARKLDPTLIRTSSIWKTDGCPLAREMRRRLRLEKFEGDYSCVYSAEPPVHPEPVATISAIKSDEPKPLGSAVHLTASFGMALAGLAIALLSNGIRPKEIKD